MSQFFEVNGEQVFASTGGQPFDRERPAIVFLHGAGLDHSFWEQQSQFFVDHGYSVLCPDYPGHTQSDGSALESIEDLATWINELVVTAGARSVSVVGHSQGSLVALEYGARYAEKLRSISFVASGLATPVNPALIEAARNAPETAIEMMVGWGFSPAPNLPDDQVATMLEGGRSILRRNVPDALATDLVACDSYRNGRTAAKAIKCPCQVVLGGKDRMAPPKAGQELAEHLDAPELAIVESSGHMLPVEAPERCQQLLRDFIFAHNPV